MICPVCKTVELRSLGHLGNRERYRCRNCGIDCSEEVEREVTCAICAELTPEGAATREPLGIGGALVIVCVDCSTLDAGDSRYSFSTPSKRRNARREEGSRAEMTTTGLGTLAIDLTCPHCGAERDRRCVDLDNRNGRLIGGFHFARVELAMSTTRKMNARLRAEREESLKHDIMIRDDSDRIINVCKGDGDSPRPHVACCAGCRHEGVCHGCGADVSRSNPTNFAGRCTSGACATCCNRLHRHPLG